MSEVMMKTTREVYEFAYRMLRNGRDSIATLNILHDEFCLDALIISKAYISYENRAIVDETEYHPFTREAEVA